MTLQDFKDKIGGKHATLMVCQVDGSTFVGQTYNAGDMVDVTTAQAFALYKQMANSPGGDIHRWEPKDASMTTGEAALLNKHFEKEHEKEIGEKPIQIKKHKK